MTDTNFGVKYGTQAEYDNSRYVLIVVMRLGRLCRH